MIFMQVFKCRRCGDLFVSRNTQCSQKHSPFSALLHEHECGANEFGLADSVGYDKVNDITGLTNNGQLD